MSIKIYSVRWEIGAHLPFNKEINASLLNAIQQGMYALQIFMGNPKSFTRQPIHEEDIRICQTLIKKYPTNIFTHFPYTANLAGKSKKDGLAWNNNAVVDRNLNITLKGLEYELSVVARIGKGVVIHPGSFPDRDIGHQTVSKTINRINFTPKSMLLLENCAGEGNKLCKTFKEIGTVISLVDEKSRKHIGVCVDTAHIWGQGDYDLRKVEEVERLFQDFDEEIGIDNFKLLHLNDSSVELGSKKDRHAHIATGKIWSQDQKSLIWLLDKCTYYKIPIILETGGPCMYTLSLLDFE
jgi:apurinic endonuclease APN1